MLGPPPSASCGRATLRPPRVAPGPWRRGDEPPALSQAAGTEELPVTSSYSFLRHLAVAAFRARAVRCVGVSDAPAFFPPSLAIAARYFRGAAGMRLAIHPSLGGEQQQDGRDVHPDRVVIDDQAETALPVLAEATAARLDKL